MNEHLIPIASLIGTAIAGFFAYRSSIKGSKVDEVKIQSDSDTKRLETSFELLTKLVDVLRAENENQRTQITALHSRIDVLFNDKMELSTQLQVLGQKYAMLEMVIKKNA